MDWSYRSLFVLCLVCVQGHQTGTNFLFLAAKLGHRKSVWAWQIGMDAYQTWWNEKIKTKTNLEKGSSTGTYLGFLARHKDQQKRGKKEKIFDPKPPTPPNCVNYLNDQCPLFNFAAKLWWSLCLTSTTGLIYLPHTDFPGLESDHVQ